MFFNVFNRVIVCSALAALAACGGGDPVATPATAIHQSSPAAVQHPAPVTDAGQAAMQGGGAARAAVVVSAEERNAEQLRMVPYEQAFSREMQRRAQERPAHLSEPASPTGDAGAATACDAPGTKPGGAECLSTQPGAAVDPATGAL